MEDLQYLFLLLIMEKVFDDLIDKIFEPFVGTKTGGSGLDFPSL